MQKQKGIAEQYRQAVRETAQIFRLTEREAHQEIRDQWLMNYKEPMAQKDATPSSDPKQTSGPVFD